MFVLSRYLFDDFDFIVLSDFTLEWELSPMIDFLDKLSLSLSDFDSDFLIIDYRKG